MLECGLPPNVFLAPPTYNSEVNLFTLKSYGLFGEVYFDVSDKLKLTGGLVVGFLKISGGFDFIQPHITVRSLVVSYCLGVVVTFLTVVFSLTAWRILQTTFGI